MAEKEEVEHDERKLHDETMQSKNRELPPGEPMSPEIQAKWDRITKDLHSWVDPAKIREVLEKGEPRIYWGTATTGKPHLGYFVPIYKISDYLAAGCHVTILFANLHGFLDNMKSSWELLNYRMQFYELIIKGMLEYIGVPLDRLKFVRGTDFQLSEKYTLDMYRMAATVTTEHTSKAGAEVVKQVANPLMSSLLYPILQALDEEYLGVNIQFGGVDQRKIFMFAREKLPLIGYRKRAYLMNPLIPGLGKSGKMSSSEPLSKIDFDDTEEEVVSKIRKSYSVDGAVEGNGLLAITKYILFRRIEAEGRKLIVPRPPKFGGDMSFSTYEEVEAAFVLPEDSPNKLFSSDLKKGVLTELLPMIAHMRKIVTEHQELKDKAYPAEKAAANAAAPAKAAAAKGPAPKKAAGDDEACPSLLDFRVGEVLEVSPHPSSDTLYVEKIDVGEAAPRQIVSGLAKHVTIEEFKGKRVLVFCNLKASNFRGVKSEGMVLAASLDDKVEILSAPANSKAGDAVHIGEKGRHPVDVIDPKKKNNIWNGETAKPAALAQEFHVDSEGNAKWKDEVVHVAGVPATAPTLRNARIS